MPPVSESETALDVIESFMGEPLNSSTYREALGKVSLREYGTYLAEDAPRAGEIEPGPDVRKVMEALSPVMHRVEKRAKAAVRSFGEAEKVPEWAEPAGDGEGGGTDSVSEFLGALNSSPGDDPGGSPDGDGVAEFLTESGL